jgi:hypothetical protein
MRNLRITCGSRALKCGDRRAALKAAYSCCRQIKRAEQPKDPKTPTSGTQGSPKDRRNTRSAQIPPFCRAECGDGAGWSSPVARQAHNLKAAGSNPAPATKLLQVSTQKALAEMPRAFLCAEKGRHKTRDADRENQRKLEVQQTHTLPKTEAWLNADLRVSARQTNPNAKRPALQPVFCVQNDDVSRLKAETTRLTCCLTPRRLINRGGKPRPFRPTIHRPYGLPAATATDRRSSTTPAWLVRSPSRQHRR